MISPGGPYTASPALEELAQRVVPAVDFFVYSLLAGIVLALGLLLDSTALFVLGALLAPFMGPVIGLSLATTVGSLRFFLQSLAGLGIGGLLVFLCGALAGWIVQFLPGMNFTQAPLHAVFTWPDLFVLSVGAGFATYLLVRPPHQKSALASAALAYELYVPLSVAGFGLTSGQPGLWPEGLGVFAIYLAWAAMMGTIILLVRGLRPHNLFGYTLGSTLLLVGLAALIFISGVGTAMRVEIQYPTASPTVTRTITPTTTLTSTPVPPTQTLVPTNTLVPTKTVTQTLSPVPTPVYARINAKGGTGAIIRAEPNLDAAVVKSLLNGMLVEVLPKISESDNNFWVYVRTQDGVEGWILRPLLATATPVPGW
jgi:uncharacterized membrane protein